MKLGVGISMNIINIYCNIYYILIVGYSLYFVVLSLRSELIWAKCGDAWKSPSKLRSKFFLFNFIYLLFTKWISKDCVDDFSPQNFNYTDCTQVFLLKCDYDGKCYKNLTISGSVASCPNKGSNTSDLISLGNLNFYEPHIIRKIK